MIGATVNEETMTVGGHTFRDPRLAAIANVAFMCGAKMEDSEEGGVSEKATLRDHLDNPLVFLLIIGLFVYALGCFGRAAGNRGNLPGVTSFFGG